MKHSAIAVLTACFLHSQLASADPGWSLKPQLTVATAALATRGTNFGAGRFPGRAEPERNVDWLEIWALPGLNLSWKTREAGSFSAGLVGVAAATFGDGDPVADTLGGEESIDYEEAWLRWEAGNWVVSGGMQQVVVGTGFLIADGDLDTGAEAAFWSAPRNAFDNSLVLEHSSEGISGQLFWLRGDEHQGHASLAGADLSFALSETASLGAQYFEITEADSGFDVGLPRDGMQVASARLQQLRIPTTPLRFTSEGAWQFGDGPNSEYDAWGAHVQLDLPLSGGRVVSYRYGAFSGDSDPGDNRREDFEPLYYGASEYGTWFQGEITSNYLLYNSNQHNHMLRMTWQPKPTVGTGVIFWRFELDELNYFGTPVSDRHFGDELNVFMEVTPNEHFYWTVALGYMNAGRAAEDAFGDNDNYLLGQVFLSYSL